MNRCVYIHSEYFIYYFQRLPAEYKTEAKLKEIEKQNQHVFDIMQKSMKSNDPIWKVPELQNESMKSSGKSH